MQPDFINIIGGLGRMGALMARIFSHAGQSVRVFDSRLQTFSWEDAADADVVLAAVPIPAFEEVMANLGPHTRPGGVVIDVASLKEKPVEIMLRHCRGEVIGAHPLFGPAVASLQDQLIFLCPAKTEKWLDWFKNFLEGLGASTMVIGAAGHDKLMSRVQVLRHLFLFCFGRSLMRLEFDLEKETPLSGPWFSQLLGLLDHQLEQSPELYADLALHNPSARQVYDEFAQAAGEVAGSFMSGDRDRIINLINEVTTYLRPSQSVA
ncbi:MAG: prephenate dehydrogenase/arogenate dehydrogenase family protein [Pseudomonadota bacterium]